MAAGLAEKNGCSYRLVAVCLPRPAKTTIVMRVFVLFQKTGADYKNNYTAELLDSAIGLFSGEEVHVEIGFFNVHRQTFNTVTALVEQGTVASDVLCDPFYGMVQLADSDESEIKWKWYEITSAFEAAHLSAMETWCLRAQSEYDTSAYGGAIAGCFRKQVAVSVDGYRSQYICSEFVADAVVCFSRGLLSTALQDRCGTQLLTGKAPRRARAILPKVRTLSPHALHEYLSASEEAIERSCAYIADMIAEVQDCTRKQKTTHIV